MAKRHERKYNFLSVGVLRLLTFILLTGLVAWSAPHEAVYRSVKIRTVDIFASGKVTVLGAVSDVARVRGTSLKCKLNSKIVGESLQIFYPSHTREIGCDGALSVALNPSISVSIRSYAGDLKVSGILGSVAVNQHSGSMELEEIAGPVAIRMAEGKVVASGLHSTVDLWLGRGKARLDYADFLPGTRVSLLTGDASVDLSLPADTKLQVSRRLKFGVYSSDFPGSTDPTMKITMKSESGNLHIHKKIPLLP